jgi:hypothetical protein
MCKYRISVLFTLVILLAIMSSCSKKIAANTTPKRYYYSCPMHPEIFEWNPGKCPKCGMVLEQWELGKNQRKPSNSYGGHSSSGGHSGGCH